MLTFKASAHVPWPIGRCFPELTLREVLATDAEDTMGRTDYVVTRWYRAPEAPSFAIMSKS